eukprot:IDg44t1
MAMDGAARARRGADRRLAQHFALILRTTRAPRRVVALAAMMERCVARLADAHWCVSAAMRTYLREWGVQAHIVRDTPPATFVGKRSEVPKEAHDLLCRVAEAKGDEGRHCFRQGETAMTCTRGAQWRAKPARLLVSSTSWTPDEDFSVLFAALRAVDARLRAGEDADSDGVETEVRLLVVITGRGPMREKFEARVKRAELRAVAVWCVWLAREDYPRLLALADVGVSLHASSSGLDLPMKVVDMLGCGLPVAALRYNCIRELVRDGQNGVLFSDAQELVAVLCGCCLIRAAKDALLLCVARLRGCTRRQTGGSKYGRMPAHRVRALCAGGCFAGLCKHTRCMRKGGERGLWTSRGRMEGAGWRRLGRHGSLRLVPFTAARARAAGGAPQCASRHDVQLAEYDGDMRRT